MRRLFLVCSIVLLWTAGLSADEAPTARQRQLTEELLAATHADQMWTQMIDVATRQLASMWDAKRLDEYRKLLATRINGEQVMRDVFQKVYFRYYTEDEVAQLIAFYKTPIGQKMVMNMPKVTNDAMTEVQRSVGPQIRAIIDQIAEEDRQRLRTLADMNVLKYSLDAYALSEGKGFPDAASMDELAAKLASVKKGLPVKDIWGNAYSYFVSPDHKHYRIVSAGSDGKLEPDSSRLADVPAEPRMSDSLAADIIYADGKFVQMPKAWQP